MKSIVLYTEEIDEPEEAAEELFEQAEDFVFEKNSIGIIFADEELEVYEEFYRCLAEKWSFPIFGTTALAALVGNMGCKETGISMMIMTSDECTFAADITTELTAENYMEKIKDTYERLSSGLPEKEKVVLSYSVIIDGLVGDDIIDAIEAAGADVPVYGALASDQFNFERHRVYFNEKSETAAQVMVLISGNIAPKYLCVKSISNKANISYEVTDSRDNQVFRLGNSIFLDALTQAGMGSKKTQVTSDYVLSPFIATLKKKDGVEVEVTRNLFMLDQEKGSGIFLGGVPEGTSLEVGVLSKEDVQTTVEQAFRTILSCLEKEDEEYHTILCTSCAARLLALGGDAAVEAEGYKKQISDNTSVFGMYSYGELCPVNIGEEKDINVFHNSTFTLLAF
ncbi:MAG: FIST C-terminal domain-containing protein [Lachnospiraceae bacterium]|nr:FIST C-terminal domain-containing protein [Lachnospiraceae bacterium]